MNIYTIEMNENRDEMQTQAVTDFIEKMGLAMESEGLPRISGRIFGYMIVFGGPVSFAALTTALQVSRGSISTNTRLLNDLGVIERTSFAGDRQDYFQLVDNAGAKIIVAAVSRIKHIENIIDAAQKNIPESINGSALRLQQMASLYCVIGKQLNLSLDKLEQHNSASQKHLQEQ